jgi:hypothetical protein
MTVRDFGVVGLWLLALLAVTWFASRVLYLDPCCRPESQCMEAC